MPGQRADLLLTAGNPLEDLAALADPIGVMVRGRWLARGELEERLRPLLRCDGEYLDDTRVPGSTQFERSRIARVSGDDHQL